MPDTIPLLFLLAASTIAVVAFTYRASAGVRGRRREAWELERAEWRRWISRP